MKRVPKRSYTEQYKGEAVKLAAEVGPAEAARRLEIPVKSLANWARLSRAGQALASDKRAPVSELEAENRRLRTENVRLKMERKILKNRPRATSASHMHRNRRLHWRDARTVAVCFLEGVYPREKTWPRGSRGPSCGGT